MRSYPKRNVEADEKTVDAVYMKRRPIFGRSNPHIGQKKNSTTAKMLKIHELSLSDTPFFEACRISNQSLIISRSKPLSQQRNEAHLSREERRENGDGKRGEEAGQTEEQ